MSISLSIYDLFANLLPGLLYLFAINEILKSLGGKYMELNDATFNAGSLLILALGYILGHIFNSFTYRGWYMLLYRYRKEEGRERDHAKSDGGKALHSLQKLYPDIKMRFYPRDADLLFNAIQIMNKELADRIEVLRANAIMMRNISFGLFLLAVAELINFVGQGFLFEYLGIGVVCLFGSAISLFQTSKYYEWFYKDVFRTSIHYGDSLQAVVNRIRKPSTPKSK